MNQRFSQLFAALVLLTAFWQIGEGAWIYAKAMVAQELLEDAWQQTKHGVKRVKPWPWADTWPVAKLIIDDLGVKVIVLEGSSGRTLAFGPGRAIEGATPGSSGTLLISGHRDTHFRFLKELKKGQQIRLEASDKTIFYRVIHSEVIDAKTTAIINNADGNILILVTCYPFDAYIPGGSMRYMVIAEKAETALKHRS